MAGPVQDGAGRAVPVAEAAALLGVTPETLRKRLWRGQVPGVKLDGQWFVTLSGTEQDGAGLTAGPVPDAPEQDAGPSVTEQDSAPLVAQLQSENAWLRDQVEALHERLREAHVLLAQERALPAPAAEAQICGNEPARPWYLRWAWWRR